MGEIKAKIKTTKKCGNSSHIQMSKSDINKQFLVTEWGEKDKMRAEEIIGIEETNKLKKRISQFVNQHPGSSSTAINQGMIKNINLNNLTEEDLTYLEPLMSQKARKLLRNH